MRNNKPTEDTFNAAQARILERILESPLAQYISPHTREGLKKIIEMGGKTGGFGSFVSLEFRRAGTNANLYVTAESDDRSYRDEYEQDEAGNEYARMHVQPPQVSWPCHGSQDVGTCFAWVEFYKDVCRLAADIQAEFCGSPRYWRLVRTKAQREESEAKAAAEKVKGAVRSAVDSVRSGMRVEAMRSVGLDLLKDVPDGSYEVEFDDYGIADKVKKYRLDVRRQEGAVLGMTVRTV